MLFPGTGFARRPRRARRRGQRGQRRAAARHRRRGVAAGVPRRRAAAGAGVRARRAGDPARLRLAHERPAGAPDAQRRRPAGGVPGAARPRPRGHRRQVGGHRWRWLRDRRRGAAGVDAPARCGLRAARSTRTSETPADWRGHVAEVLHQDAPTRMTDGRDSRFPGLERGLQPGDLARQVDPGHPGGRFPSEWPRSRPVMSRIGAIGGAGPNVSLVGCGSGLRLCFHTSHTRPYSHLSVARGISGGEAGDVPGKVVRT